MDFNHFPTFEDAQIKLFKTWNTRPSAQWVKVSDRLPELDGEYLCTYVNMDNKSDVAIFWFRNGGFRLDRIIAWMPLPAPYTPPSSTGAGKKG